MSSSEVSELIAALGAGEVTLDEVAARFRERAWPVTRRPLPQTAVEMARQQDPDTDVPGSYDDLTAAYDRGEITAQQYDVLCEAVAACFR